MKKVLLYLASNSTFYTNLYKQIKNGFEEAGLEVIGGYSLLEEKELLQKIDDIKPYFVFEMNRCKNEIKKFPKDVIHICWLVDFWGRKHKDIEGSDILYCWTKSWVRPFLENSSNKNVLFLPPATSKEIYYPLKNQEKANDFLFLGHIPNPWNKNELEREIGYIHNKKIQFKDILPILESYIMNKNINVSCHDFLKQKNVLLNEEIDKTLEYDITSRTFRQVRRKNFIYAFCKNKSFNTSIFGTQNWNNYEEFKTFYRGFLDSPKRINEELSKSNILLHDGNYPHFRTFDAMAAKCCVAACEVPNSFGQVWESIGFEENIHFIKVNFFSNNIDFNKFKNKNLIIDIKENAYKKVLKEHLWVHRVQTILNDIKELK
ncbi:hypothetical protein CRU98_10680 [Arcobacter sp. CECT 8986]|uniref:glycosyltransferase family protein n=1 Tax=Arcobacter sp. CECT 8986 TaxID=2044507 RepID=UPI001009A663|nr:glycosyltransferase [Arcobacter sp. CECT 8986]RXJ98218.1 hypothetical protein CRU98_10680 [Arcobacter sp. CECT 8986]